MPPKRKAATIKKGTKRQKSTTTTTTTTTPAKETKRPRKSAAVTRKSEPVEFTLTNCEKWYRSYVNTDNPDGDITPEGAQRFFVDIGISLDTVYPILIGWKMNASKMGYFTKDEWMNTMTQLRVDSPERFKQQVFIWENELEDDAAFKRFYQYTFGFAKTPGQKSMDVDIAIALWPLLLGNECNHVSSFIEFIQATKPVKVISKDQWSSLLDFTRTVPKDLEDYDATSSWPVLFDDYANWRLNT